VNDADEQELLLYPNPNRGLFSVTLPSASVFAELEVVTNLGQTVYSAQIRNKAAIQLPAVSAGIYFAKIKMDGRTVVRKIVVE
jgi:hypothetical protein